MDQATMEAQRLLQGLWSRSWAAAATSSRSDDDERVDCTDRMDAMDTSIDDSGGGRGESRDSCCSDCRAPALAPADTGDCRDDDWSTGRESAEEEEENHSGRYHVPLKRCQRTEEGASVTVASLSTSSRPKPYADDAELEPRRKRQRISDSIRASFFSSTAILTEGQQACMEYIAPASYTPFFYWLGYSNFTIQWVVFMYCCHFFQTFATDFGPKTSEWRWKSAFISPLQHLLLDSYLWNHSFITMMLLWPHWFAPQDRPDHPYWMAVGLTVFQQQNFVAITFKSTYVTLRDALPPQIPRSDEIETRLFDGFLTYGTAAIFFVLSKIYGSSFLLWVGLFIFNAAPICLISAYQKRLDAYERKARTLLRISNSGDGDTCKKKEQ